MKKTHLFLLILMLSFKMGYSQGQLLDLHYTLGFPVSKLADHISSISTKGLGVDYKYFLDDNVTFGMGVSWSAFCTTMQYDTYTFGTTTVSGKQYRYFMSLPIHVYCSYYLGLLEAPVRPFGGIGIGTTWNNKLTQVRDFKIREQGFQFSLQPEVGILFKATDYNSLLISGRFNYPFETAEIGYNPYFSLNVGLSFGL